MSITNLRFDRDCLDPELRDLGTWPSVNTGQWSKVDCDRFVRLQAAIRAYLSGERVKNISKKFRVSRQELSRLLKRCLSQHPDGQIYGWRGIIKHARQKSYVRTKPVKSHSRNKRSGDAGAFFQLLDRYPHIAEGIQKLFYKQQGDREIEEPRIPLMAIFKWFLSACRLAGLTASDYPFCTVSSGRTALWRYLKHLIDVDPQKAISARGSKHAARRWRKTGHGPSSIKATRPYQRVEFDGHRFDMSCMILIRHTHGGFVQRLLHRLWLLVIVDVYTRAILGYHISLNFEYDSTDVLLCVKNAVTPWKPRILTIPGLEYAKGAGLPSGVIPELEWVTFEDFCYDNAKANLAARVLNKITSVIGCAVNPGPVESPERRGIIERLFETLEEATGHRVPSTTGSHPQDPRRTNPDAAAEKFEITLDHLYELMDLVIARYNATPHSGIGYKAPLELMAQFAADEDSLMNKIPEDQRDKLGLLNVEFKRTVRGNIKEGRRPYINCEGARYRNEILARSPELIGQRLTLVMDPEDPRSVTAFFPDGAELGDLTANSFWGVTPHTLEMRKAILSLINQRLLYLTENQDPIPVYLAYLATGQKSKSRSRALAKAHLHNTVNKTSTDSTARPADEKAPAGEQETEKRNRELGRTFTF
ncbi:MAG TPA: hypothetical protein VNO50_22220 [Pyrinomonadaceae bacterium]|nr:hypothetical protein [Pyrinomonadaceae bacterium]